MKDWSVYSWSELLPRLVRSGSDSLLEAYGSIEAYIDARSHLSGDSGAEREQAKQALEDLLSEWKPIRDETVADPGEILRALDLIQTLRPRRGWLRAVEILGKVDRLPAKAAPRVLARLIPVIQGYVPATPLSDDPLYPAFSKIVRLLYALAFPRRAHKEVSAWAVAGLMWIGAVMPDGTVRAAEVDLGSVVGPGIELSSVAVALQQLTSGGDLQTQYDQLNRWVINSQEREKPDSTPVDPRQEAARQFLLVSGGA